MKFSINKKKQKDMKLRHLLLASFAACTFASCSDDSSNGIEIPEENYQMIDANVSLTAMGYRQKVQRKRAVMLC